jgi:hypothetical protein
VVAEPGPASIERDHERVRCLQFLQNPLPARRAGQQVGERAVDPLEHRGAQQQPPDFLGLVLENLGQQVLGHSALGTGELGGEPLRIGMPGQQQRGQPQPRRPPFGPLVQQRPRRIGHLDSGRRKQSARLVEGEAQSIGADLGQPALQAQAVRPQPQIMSGGENEPQLPGRAHQQQFDLLQRVPGTQLVHVVEHQPDTILERAQVL